MLILIGGIASLPGASFKELSTMSTTSGFPGALAAVRSAGAMRHSRPWFCTATPFERHVDLLGGLGRVDNRQRQRFPVGGQCRRRIQRVCVAARGGLALVHSHRALHIVLRLRVVAGNV